MAAGSGEALDWASARWRRAACCTDASCVEVAMLGDAVGVRDSKRRDCEPLVFSRAEWEAFCRGVRLGEFDVA